MLFILLTVGFSRGIVTSSNRALGEYVDFELGRLRLNTHTGRPLGSDSFLSKLKRLLGRMTHPLPVGRPSKDKKAKRKRKIS